MKLSRLLAFETILVVSARIFAVFFALLFNLRIASVLGSEATAVFFIYLSVAMILTVVGRLGLDNYLMRDLSIAHERKELQTLSDLLSGALTVSVFAHGVVFVVLAVVLGVVQVGVGVLEIATAAFAVLQSACFILAAYFRATDRYLVAMLVSGVLHPFVALLLLVVVPADRLTATSAHVVNASGALVALSVGLLMYVRSRPASESSGFRTQNRNELVRGARGFWYNSLVSRAILPWAPILYLGYFGTKEDTGVFGIASRLGVVNSVLLVALYSVLAPRFARLYADNEIHEIRSLMVTFTGLMTVLTLPLTLIVVFFADEGMALLGSDFAEGGAVLANVTLANFLFGVSGIARFVLTMTGAERQGNAIGLTTVLVQAVLFGVLVGGITAVSASRVVLASFVVYALLHVGAALVQTRPGPGRSGLRI